MVRQSKEHLYISTKNYHFGPKQHQQKKITSYYLFSLNIQNRFMCKIPSNLDKLRLCKGIAYVRLNSTNLFSHFFIKIGKLLKEEP
ncbi:hypothetical protein BpHYR1_044557 [Brachionus plicatilis]|uniref:Uncharacterized protein n=1 Tax=Brachionus plicatilis TaxID=10195 RepID=A0A3M7R1R9_BRAPC|nr:hypothetical protein BpHYR1_044557 [Brachionus plicatilis]